MPEEEGGEDDLSKLLALAEQGIKASSSCRCNRFQSQALSDLLSSLVSCARHWKLFFASYFIGGTKILLDALYTAVQHAVRLLTDYCDKQWHVKALVSQENALGFECLAELVSRYVDMVNSQLLVVVEDRDHVQELISKFSKDYLLVQRFLREAASLDRNDLRKKAEKQLQNSSSLFNKTTKASLSKLARKLQSRNSSDKFDVDLKELVLSNKKLGSGSSASVVEGQWMELRVAVKLYEKDDNIHFNAEVAIMRGLQPSHPNIVQILGVAEDRNKRYLVMELMDMNLEKYLLERSSKLSLAEQVDIMLQIASGVLFLHRNNVCYRDLKPGNLLVKKEPFLRVKLADFGHSKPNFRSMDPNTNKAGTLLYMAPEVRDKTYYTKKADVFSFGIVCAEILTGLRGISKSDLGNRIERGERPGIDQCTHAELKKLVKRCWMHATDQRPEFEEIHSILWEVKRELLTGERPRDNSARALSMVSVPSGLFSPDEEVGSPGSSSVSSQSSLTCPPSVYNIRVTGASVVGSTLVARWPCTSGTFGYRVQWGRYVRQDMEQPEWPYEPVQLSNLSTLVDHVLSPDDYGAWMCLRVMPLSGDVHEASWRSETPVTLEPASQSKLEKYLADCVVSFNVNIEGHFLSKLNMEAHQFHLWWSMGSLRNFREPYSEACFKASMEDPKCCIITSKTRGKSFRVAFADTEKRNIAVVAMKQFLIQS